MSKETTKTTKTSKLTDLTKEETKTLTAATRKLKTALKNFLVFGEEHNRIKDLVLLRYKSLRHYVEDELGITESDYYRRVRAYEVHEVLRKADIPALPQVESVCRQVTLNLLSGLIKECTPDEVKGMTPEQCLIEIWKDAYEKKVEKAGDISKADKAKIKLTANDVFLAKNRWKAIHSGQQPVEPIKPPVKKTIEPDVDAADSSGMPAVPDLPVHPRQAAFADKDKAIIPDEDTQPASPTKSEKEQLQSKVAEYRTELAKLRAENSKLALGAKVQVKDWQKSPLFKDIFEAGKQQLIAKAMETSDEKLVKSIQELERLVFAS